MDKLQNNYLPCKKCERNTLHYKRDKVMNWLLHIFLTFITFGFYLFVLVFIAINHALNKPADLWICSQCDEAEQPITETKKIDRTGDWLIILLLILVAIASVAIQHIE